MKNITVTITILMVCLAVQADVQTVYSVKYASEADVKVYVVNYKSEADLGVYRVKYASEANGNEGKWYFVKYKSEAGKKIYFVDYKSQADLNIYFVKYKSEAGWKDVSKKHLMYCQTGTSCQGTC